MIGKDLYTIVQKHLAAAVLWESLTPAQQTAWRDAANEFRRINNAETGKAVVAALDDLRVDKP